ncbi:MAG: hypothetical protein V4541_15220 [Bacteroidota bacterium]
MNIALVTYQDKGLYASPTAENEDDRLLNFLITKGLKIEKVIWNDPQIKWENYELAILKSPWDYFDLIEDFYTWLGQLKQKDIRLLNPIDIVKWNADKHYLQDIANAGLNVTPSIFINKGDRVDLKDYFDQLNTDKFIIKPSVSGGSKNTFKVTATNVHEIEAKMNTLLLKEDFIVQPFLTEIEKVGEWSFLFFGGKYSHALLKKVKTGDFRVQHSHGGTIHPQQPSQQAIESAQQYVDQFAKDCLYARVDGAIVNGEFLLMELELIEPFLFLATNEYALENYYQALLAVGTL